MPSLNPPQFNVFTSPDGLVDFGLVGSGATITGEKSSTIDGGGLQTFGLIWGIGSIWTPSVNIPATQWTLSFAIPSTTWTLSFGQLYG